MHARFFAQDAVSGVGGSDSVDEQCFALLVHFGHNVVHRTFGLDAEMTASKLLHLYLACLHGPIDGVFEYRRGFLSVASSGKWVG